MNIIEQIESAGQSFWYDNIERAKLLDGSIASLISEGKITGMTSNPSIFQKAIANSSDYDMSLKPMSWAGLDDESIFWQMAIEDIRMANELFMPVYLKTNGKDGFVSLEVNPLLGYDTSATQLDATNLWKKVNYPNVMIKIPATREGIPAIRNSITAGINVNITLIFSLDRYSEVMEAYLSGLEERMSKNLPLNHISSVASFFVSRIDTKIDAMLENLHKDGKIDHITYNRLAGKAAIASARLAYAKFETIFKSERFKILQKHGANIQRPLWASTSTKNPQYRDVLYVEELIAPQTVNTMPPATLDAFLDHGHVETTIYKEIDQAPQLFEELKALGISIDQVTAELELEGVKAFSNAYTSLLESVEQRRFQAVKELGSIDEDVKQKIENLDKKEFAKRFFAKDPTLWTESTQEQAEIKNRMNWISTPYENLGKMNTLNHLAGEYRSKGFTHAVLLGMGGSSLAPEVISKILGNSTNVDNEGLTLRILDSTDPDQVRAVAEGSAIEKTVYLVASKSGTTGEINAFLDYFWQQVKSRNPKEPGSQFLAVTDPGTKLEKIAIERKFSHVFLSDPGVGGRNSALTLFGMVPAALMGINLDKFSQNAVNMANLCKADRPLTSNPGMVLGVILGTAALNGKNKVTLLTNEEWAPFGSWLEQLVAESSGKIGKGMLPIANEPEMEATTYSQDRIFINLEHDQEKAEFIEQLKNAGHPVISLHIGENEDLAGQFYLWEIAIATACAVIGVNSFDQPDVQDAKLRTLAGLDEYRKAGRFPEVIPSAEYPRLKILSALPPDVEKRGSITRLIGSYIENNKQSTEFIAINAFLPQNSENEILLQEFRRRLGTKYHLPTTLGFGPRYLHSTGQFHKGGPNTGLFILLTAQREHDLEIPGEGIGFSVFQRAQAIGDLQALQAKGRKVLWIDLAVPDLNILLDR